MRVEEGKPKLSTASDSAKTASEDGTNRLEHAQATESPSKVDPRQVS